jgi:hypothetical protein
VAFEVGAQLGTLDVFLSIDTTGSFGGEIDALQGEITSAVVPSLGDRVPDVAVGVGRFEDFPEAPWGSEDDRPFRLVTAVTTDLARVSSAVASLDSPLGIGGDLPESGAEALWQIATGEGYTTPEGAVLVPRFVRTPGGGSIGGVGFREGALHVVVHVTDAPSHRPSDYEPRFPGTRSLRQAGDALVAIGARAIGIASGPTPRLELEELAARTGALAPPEPDGCHTGVDGSVRPPVGGMCPLVFDVELDGSGLTTAIVDAIHDLLDTVAWAEVWGQADDPSSFVRAIRAVDAVVPPGVPVPGRADRRPADGIDDTFEDVRPGTDVRFEAVLRNETIPPADYDQVFRVRIEILGDGLTLVERTIRVVVPRGRLDAGIDGAIAPASDAGDDAGQEDAGVGDGG